jgi:hypothetical protein
MHEVFLLPGIHNSQPYAAKEMGSLGGPLIKLWVGLPSWLSVMLWMLRAETIEVLFLGRLVERASPTPSTEDNDTTQRRFGGEFQASETLF